MSWMDQPTVIVIGLAFAVFRIYLEVVQFNFASLPLTSRLPQASREKIHRTGFWLSVGYLVLFAPELLLA